MEKLTINGNTFSYVGQPLTAMVFDGMNYMGRSNVSNKNQEDMGAISLNNLDDAFKYMKEWIQDEEYAYGYVLDYSTKTIYYDDDRVLDYLLKKVFPKLEKENYFKIFTKMNFKNN